MALAFLSEDYLDYTFVADARQALNDVADNLTFMVKMTVDAMDLNKKITISEWFAKQRKSQLAIQLFRTRFLSRQKRLKSME